MKNKIFSKILLAVKPSSQEEQEIRKEVSGFISLLNNALKKARIKAEAITGGSFAKETMIKKDKYDVDIFAVFDQKYKSEEISGVLEKILNKIRAKSVKLPGSRDYFSVAFKQFKAEIVPVIKIKKSADARNVTDLSLLHVDYIRKKTKANKKLGDEIRLVKAFCYANNLYGAESHIKGFSGYCLELLTSHYGSFLNLAKAAAKWKAKEIVDPMKYYRKKNVFIELNESKLISPLILIDPVQKDRNAAAALSDEKFKIFTELCRKFVKKPSEKFFERKILNERKIIEDAKKNRAGLYIVVAKSEKKKEDISGAKLLKLFNMLKEMAEKEGYKAKTEWNFKNNEAKMFFSVKKPGKILRAGPFLDMHKHVSAFKKKYKKHFMKGKRIYASVIAKPLEKIFSLDKAQLSAMDIDKYFFRKIV
jgi:tRNA nucleotidyltransferase (CCA-adding enzyme)